VQTQTHDVTKEVTHQTQNWPVLQTAMMWALTVVTQMLLSVQMHKTSIFMFLPAARYMQISRPIAMCRTLHGLCVLQIG